MVSKATDSLALHDARPQTVTCCFRDAGKACGAPAVLYPVAVWETAGGVPAYLVLDLPHCAEHKEIADALKLPLGAVDWSRVERQVRGVSDRKVNELAEIAPGTLVLVWHDRPYLTCSFCGRTDTTHANDCIAVHFQNSQEFHL